MATTSTVDRATGVQRVEVGERAWGRLQGADYADAFRVGSVADRTPERWARRTFEGGSPTVRRVFALVVWRGALGLRLVPEGTPGSVAGWPAVVDEPGTLVLRVDGWMLAGCLVVDAGDHEATVTTLLRFDRPPARAVWGVLGFAHRALMPIVLGRAARVRVQPPR